MDLNLIKINSKDNLLPSSDGQGAGGGKGVGDKKNVNEKKKLEK
jgi:hypothetical protein